MSAFSASSTRDEVRRLMALALPVVVAQLGGMLMGVVDTAMMGRVGAREVAAASLGHIVLMATAMPMMGLLMGSDPLMSQAHGANDRQRIALLFQRTLALVPLVFLVVVAGVAAGPTLLAWAQQPADVIPLANDYARITMWSTPSFLAFQVTRQFLQVRGIVRPAMWIMLGSNLLNAFGNWVLIYGNLGAPALGLEGSAISTVVTRLFMLLWLVAWIWRKRLHAGYWRPWDRQSFAGLKPIVRFGAPIALGFAVESWAFQAASLLAGPLGEDAVATQAVVFQVIALVFMVPLGIQIGAAVRVGNLIGANDSEGAQRTAHVALGVGAAFMGAMSIVFLVGRDWLPRVFTNDPELIALAAPLFPIAAAFQVFDGTQTICSGILRGMGNTTLPAIAHALGFYAIGLPAAYVMLQVGDAELAEIWWGTALGLFVVAAVMAGFVLLRGPRWAVALRQG